MASGLLVSVVVIDVVSGVGGLGGRESPEGGWRVVFAGSDDRGQRPGVLRGLVRAGAGGQLVSGASVLSLWNAASSVVAQRQLAWRCRRARRPENASLPATCSSW